MRLVRREWPPILRTNPNAYLYRAAVSLERTGGGLTIHLNTGSIIINAAQPTHVQTATTVSGGRSVFLVNAANSTAQIAVIQGEVQVRDRISLKMQGPPPLAEEIAWSRNAAAHMALLRESLARLQPPPLPLSPSLSAQTEIKPTAAPARLEFAVVSIRPNVKEPGGGYYFKPGGPNGPTWGFACRGTDGIRGGIFGTRPALVVPQGRCVGNGVAVAQLMNYVFGTPWRYGPGIPVWARQEMDQAGMPTSDWFQIEAVAPDPATATTAQLRTMLRTMLADRFRLKIHQETQELDGYALVVDGNRPKLKESAGPVEQPSMILINGRAGIRGKSSLDELTRFLTEFINMTAVTIPFVNKTALSGIYEYEFPTALSTEGGARGAGGAPAVPPALPSRSERIANRAAEISDAMKERLGLRLQREKIRTGVVVIGYIEKPSQN